jgi:hypothetical protein
MRLKIIKFKKKNKVGSSLFYIIVGYKYKGISKKFIFEQLGVLNYKHPKLLSINLMRLGY